MFIHSNTNPNIDFFSCFLDTLTFIWTARQAKENRIRTKIQEEGTKQSWKERAEETGSEGRDHQEGDEGGCQEQTRAWEVIKDQREAIHQKAVGTRQV